MNCVWGVIRSELMHGAYSEKNLEEISQKLNYITEKNMENKEWDEFGRFLYKLRTNGISVPYADAALTFAAGAEGSKITMSKNVTANVVNNAKGIIVMKDSTGITTNIARHNF